MPYLKCPGCGRGVRLQGLAAMCPHCGGVVATGNQAYVKVDAPPTPPPPQPQERPAQDAWRPPSEEVIIPAPLTPSPPPSTRWGLIALISTGVVAALLAIGYLIARLTSSSDSPAPAPVVQAAPERAATLPDEQPQNEAPSVDTTPTVPVPRPAPGTPAPRRDDSKLAALRPAKPRQASPLLTDEQIGQAIRQGVQYVVPHFPNSRLQLPNPESMDPSMQEGVTALCTYALLHAGQAVEDPQLKVDSPFIRDLIAQVKLAPMDGTYATYSRSLRVATLTLYQRPEDRSLMLDDARWLIDSSLQGAYDYRVPQSRYQNSPMWDHSNAQYGALGVWMAQDAGVEVSASYWTDIVNHWVKEQFPSGGWSYRSLGMRGTTEDQVRETPNMTVAGSMALFVAREKLASSPAALQAVQPGLDNALARALRWLDEGDNSIRLAGGYGYYGLERLGLASGIKYFGTHDWYAELASRALQGQLKDGSWKGKEGPLIETAFHLLFLSRGRHPSFVAKIRLDDSRAAWGRDVANLTKFASRQLERPLNYQMVSLDRDWLDWTDSPVLFISSDQALQLSEKDATKLREFANSGGMLFTNADGGAEPFTNSVTALAKRLFPQYPLEALPEDHPIYSVVFPVRQPPQLLGVSNGSRMLLVHSPTDIAAAWARNNERLGRPALELGTNVVMYATGKRELRNRLDESRGAPPAEAATGRMPIARVRYGGNWDPEPVAWVQMGWAFQNETGIGLDVQPADLRSLGVRSPAVAHLTGTAAQRFSLDEVAAVRQYVETGGLLVVDSCGGGRPFIESVKRNLLAAAFPKATFGALPPTHPVLAGSGTKSGDNAAEGSIDARGPAGAGTDNSPTGPLALMSELSQPRLRMFALANWSPDGDAALEWLDVGDGHVLISNVDLTSGLLGTRSWGIVGCTPAYARALVKNVLLWRIALAQQPAAGR